MRLDFVFSQIAHQIQRAFFESQGHLATEVQVFLGADSPIDNIKGLGEQDAQQPVADSVLNILV